MTTVAINFTQATLDGLAVSRAAANSATLTLGQQFDRLIRAGYEFSANHYYYDDILLQAPESWLTFSDSAYQYMSGVTLTGTTSGTVTATRLEDYVPGAYSLVYEGRLQFGYANNAGSGIVLSNNGGTINGITLKSLLATDAPQYDKLYGNATIAMQGALTSPNANQFSGTVASITVTHDKFLASTHVAGTFNVSGSSVEIGLGASSVSLDGTLTSLKQTYADGSTFSIGSPMAVTGASMFDDRILSNSAYFTGNDTISVTLPATLATPFAVDGGNGDDRITITGGGSNLSASGGNGNDTIVLGDHGHRITGGAGIDLAVFGGKREAYTVAASVKADGDSTVTAAGGLADTLSGVERIQFDNASVALDIAGNAGQAYRLYQAAYHRTPDLAGLGYWIKQMDNGLSLRDMAGNFTRELEYYALYGVNPGNAELVNNYYRNALHREPDAAGFAYWHDLLERQLLTSVDLLVMFSESAENQAAVLPVIGKGIAYTPFSPLG